MKPERRASWGAALAVAATLAAGSVQAEIYKWVDEQGVVNYGERLPATRPAQVLSSQNARVSVYTPPPLPKLPAVDPLLAARVDQLERQLYRERRDADTLEQLAAERELRRLELCREQRRVDCDDGYGSDGYGGVAIYAPPYFRPGFDRFHDGHHVGKGKFGRGHLGQVHRHKSFARPLPGSGMVAASGRVGIAAGARHR